MQRTALAAILAFAHLGCASVLAPQPDPSKFYLLTPAVEPIAANQPSEISVALGPIAFPTYLLRAGLVTRVSGSRLTIDDTKRWAEPLDENFVRVLAANLRALLGTERIFIHPYHAGRDLTYQVEIEVVRFEMQAGSGVELISRWQISDVKSRDSLSNQKSALSAPAPDGDDDAIVTALSRTVADLSREIAGELRRIDQKR